MCKCVHPCCPKVISGLLSSKWTHTTRGKNVKSPICNLLTTGQQMNWWYNTSSFVSLVTHVKTILTTHDFSHTMRNQLGLSNNNVQSDRVLPTNNKDVIWHNGCDEHYILPWSHLSSFIYRLVVITTLLYSFCPIISSLILTLLATASN